MRDAMKFDMCLFPKFIKNPRYLPNKKNLGYPPFCDDMRKMYVPVGCGNCIECRKQKARGWQMRLNEELKIHKYNYFITLTFAPEELNKLTEETNKMTCNAVAGLAVRRMLERTRQKYKKLPFKHWLITELGHIGTERIHLHGILFSDIEITNETLERLWKYGKTDTGQYCNNRSIGYIVKYVTKIDTQHKDYNAQIFCSAGLGKSYADNPIYKDIHKYKPKNSIEYYTLDNGGKINLCTYYRNKFFTEDEREKLWIEKLNRHTIFVRGIEINKLDTLQGQINYAQTLEEQQKKNAQLGYGNNNKEWKKKDYNITLKMLNKEKK